MTMVYPVQMLLLSDCSVTSENGVITLDDWYAIRFFFLYFFGLSLVNFVLSGLYFSIVFLFIYGINSLD